MAEEGKALIAGVTCVIGYNLAKYLLGENSKHTLTKVYGVSRRSVEGLPNELQHIPCNLLDVEDVRTKIGPLKDVTHMFFCAVWYNMEEKGVSDISSYVPDNTAMLRNLLEALNSPVEHAILVTGTKHYFGERSEERRVGKEWGWGGGGGV